jgi:tRNA threonylcarbamoyladenosine biosynthesis protein TsaE
MEKIITQSEKETMLLGKAIASACQGGEVFGLTGNLGAGKTCLTKGLAKGLGIKGIINSPTFVIMKVYNLKKKNIKKFCHIDAYRLQTAGDLEAIGASEYFNRPDTVTVIEWAENVKKILPKKTITIKLQAKNNSQRVITIK